MTTTPSDIVNPNGSPLDPRDEYISDPQLPSDDGSSALKKDLSGHRPVELILHDLLTFSLQNLNQMAQDPTSDVFENIFAFLKYYGLQNEDGTTTTMLEAVKKYFAATKFEVNKNFPKKEYPLPIIAIHNAEEDEADGINQVFHHEMLHTDPSAGSQEELVGHNIDARVEVFVITDDPMTTLILYRVIWFIIFANKFHLESYADMRNVKLSGGAISFDQAVFPNWSYARQMNVRYSSLFDFYMPKTGVPAGINFKMMLQQLVNQVNT